MSRQFILTALVFLGLAAGVYGDSLAVVDNTQGIVKVSYPATADSGIKVMVALGTQSYTYDQLRPVEAYPLQFGDGTYKISLYQRVQGTQFRLLKQTTVTVDLPDDFVPFLGSSQILNWHPDMVSISMAKTLTANAATDAEKLRLVYGYITAKIRYDYAKISKLKSTYLPDIEDTYATNLGICYDYSALFGSMLRSVGVPAKLIKGYKNDIPEYHAWNQVYLDNKWHYIDTTYDAAFKAAGAKTTMLKSDSEFRAAKFY
jgi:transglutaminase-like putative cysteine protease